MAIQYISKLTTAEQLIPLGKQFCETKLWYILAEDDIFAVKLRNGEIGYISILGNAGAHYALSLYIGNQGFNSFRNYDVISKLSNKLEIMQMAFLMDCINCDFSSRWEPEFVRYFPREYPSTPKAKEDLEAMEDALQAAIYIIGEIKKKGMFTLGFNDGGIRRQYKSEVEVPLLTRTESGFKLSTSILPGRTEPKLPNPIFNSPELVLSMSMLPRKSNYECRFITLNAPIKDGEDGSYLPVMLLTVDGQNGMIKKFEAMRFEEDKSFQDMLLTLAANIIADKACPSKIFVMDDYTQAILSDFCARTGIPMQRVRNLKHLEEAWASISAFLKAQI